MSFYSPNMRLRRTTQKVSKMMFLRSGEMFQGSVADERSRSRRRLWYDIHVWSCRHIQLSQRIPPGTLSPLWLITFTWIGWYTSIHLEGSTSRKCQQDGKWSGREPVCVSK